MRLLYFTREWTGHDRRFVTAFCEHGITVAVLTLRHIPSEIVSEGLPAGAQFLGTLGLDRETDDQRLDGAVSEYCRQEMTYSPDLVLVGPLTDCAYVKALAASAVPWVAQSWAFDVFWEYRQNTEFARRVTFTLRQCPALFADCQAVVTRCEELAGRSFPSRFLMPWGIDLKEIQQPRDREALRRALGLEEFWVLLHTRGLEPIYGIGTLLDAFRLAQRHNQALLLLLASGGSLLADVKRFVARNHLQSAVRLLGPVPHSRVLDLFAAADGYISAAFSDGTSVSLLEAMASGVPPIVTNAGGNVEWVRTLANGWIAPMGNPKRLTRAIVEASNLTHSRRLQIVSRNCHEVGTRANWNANFQNLISFLRQTAGVRRQPIP
jgi:glycosyltransferase involved in cell wall biosynthesis